MINAGKYNHRISILRTTVVEDAQGYQTETTETYLTCYASVKTTRGMTLIKNNTDFEKAYTNFTIRYPVELMSSEETAINRDMLISFKGKTYSIEYINNVNEENVELEMQAKEVTH